MYNAVNIVKYMFVNFITCDGDTVGLSSLSPLGLSGFSEMGQIHYGV